MLDGIDGHFLDAQGDPAGKMIAAAVGFAEFFRLAGNLHRLLQGGDTHFHGILGPDAEGGGEYGAFPAAAAEKYIEEDEEDRQALADGKVQPDALHAPEGAEDPGGQGGQQEALQDGDGSHQGNPARGLEPALGDIDQAAGKEAQGRHSDAQHRHIPGGAGIRLEQADHGGRGQEEDGAGDGADDQREADQAFQQPLQAASVLLAEKHPGQGEGDAVKAGGDAVGGVQDSADDGEGGHRLRAAGMEQQKVHDQHDQHAGDHGEGAGRAAPEELGGLFPGRLFPGETEDAFFRQEVNQGNPQGDIIAEGGSQPHAEHAAVEDQDVKQIQHNVRHGHAQHGDDQEGAFARHLQEGNQGQGGHGGRSADDEARQVVLRVQEKLLALSGAQEGGDGPPQGQNQDHEGQGEGQHNEDGGGIRAVRFLPGAGAQGLAAGHLHAGAQHAGHGPDGQQHRIGQLVGGDGLHTEETVDHDIVNQQAERNGQRGKNLRRQHLSDYFSGHGRSFFPPENVSGLKINTTNHYNICGREKI